MKPKLTHAQRSPTALVTAAGRPYVRTACGKICSPRKATKDIEQVNCPRCAKKVAA